MCRARDAVRRGSKAEREGVAVDPGILEKVTRARWRPRGKMTMNETAGFMAMKGAGYYSKATTGARDVINLAIPLIIGAVDRMGLADDGTRVRVADMGCADGGTSMGMWREVLGHLRRKLPSRPVEIVYTDLPRNDFSQLFRTIHNQTDIESYYAELDEIYPYASGTSFHQKSSPRKASTSPSRRPPRITSPRCRATSPTMCIWWVRAAPSAEPMRRSGATNGQIFSPCEPASSFPADGSSSSISASTKRDAISAIRAG